MTPAARSILAWIGRNALALVLILAILIVGRYLYAPTRDWISGQIRASRAIPESRETYASAEERLRVHLETRAREVEEATRRLSAMPADRLRARRARIEPAKRELEGERLSSPQLAWSAARGDADAIFGHYRAGAELALLDREARYIDALLAAGQGQAGNLEQRRSLALARLRSSHQRFQAANAEVARLNRRPMAGARNLVCDRAYVGLGCENFRALEAARNARDAALAENRRALREIRMIDSTRARIAQARNSAQDVARLFEAQRTELEQRIEDVDQRARGNWILWAKRPILETLPLALAILSAAILLPVAIKALLYFLIAPIAARRPPIRLVPSDRGEADDENLPSAVSQRIALDETKELLVVPEALQSTPHHAAKSTLWLLSWAMPLSSLASNMVALVRIHAAQRDFVLVSATHDPFAEIGLVAIEEGSAMVVRPRALRGLVRPVGAPVRITRHWRLNRLSAWLTFQFRYLVFHGPVTLLVQGNRGIRLEPASQGRGINQAATIGFSAGLLYSVRRSEAFGPYLLGRQDLFNDSFDGPGFALYEEMPREGERKGIWGRGLRGLGDAFLKVFGI